MILVSIIEFLIFSLAFASMALTILVWFIRHMD